MIEEAMDETRPDPYEGELREWRESLAADETFLANVDALAQRAEQGELPEPSGSLEERLARLNARRKG